MLIKKISAALQLVVQFFWLMVKSGFATLFLIIKLQLKRKQSLRDRYVSFEIPNSSETGLAVLGCLISLTPGTTLLNIDTIRRKMLLHILDSDQTDEVIQEIRQKFIPHIVILFGNT
ncbi:hypothetical protein OA57_04565 [Chelonobacter oris]|uniref:Sodium:proton antiporter n=1 Tax=Chelonobacter oris TaxID=505317 RepID=A0A0A3BAT5_9PAST|nr:Na+/H+ antiporter subunit E [Chelonobacter oris]KGQ70649.1 hypothetical protein OA57_04565 [Chelonobacter oris]